MTDPIDVTLVRLEGKFDVMDEKIDHIRKSTERQEGCLLEHGERIRCLEAFKGKMKGIWIAVGGILAIIAALAAL
jgi:hypothetical protein